jgi:hypothetical protein
MPGLWLMDAQLFHLLILLQVFTLLDYGVNSDSVRPLCNSPTLFLNWSWQEICICKV